MSGMRWSGSLGAIEGEHEERLFASSPVRAVVHNEQWCLLVSRRTEWVHTPPRNPHKSFKRRPHIPRKRARATDVAVFPSNPYGTY